MPSIVKSVARRGLSRVLAPVGLLCSFFVCASAWAQSPRLVGFNTPAASTSYTNSASPSYSGGRTSAPSLSHVSTPTARQIAPRRSGQACWDEAARYHGLDPWLLYAVAYVESTHNPAVISKPNRNGTYDIGLMQINSVHLPRLARYGITQAALMDACTSTYVGAWIMSENIRRYGWSWEAIAAYNVGSLNSSARRTIGRRYAGKVYEAYGKLSRQYGGNVSAANGPVPAPSALSQR